MIIVTKHSGAATRRPALKTLMSAVLMALTSTAAIAESLPDQPYRVNKAAGKQAETVVGKEQTSQGQTTPATAKRSAQSANEEQGKAEKATTEEVNEDNSAVIMDEMVVTEKAPRDSHYTSPSTRVTRSHIERQNAQTTEEVLKYQPSLQIRQRYIGDPNGVLGIRGADMFSTARNMVFADGLPLHNQLQASFNGAPRWSMVGPNEIDSVDVVYGPFSAEYSGNSIGGVVNMKTHMPMKEEYYMEGSFFVQPWKFIGDDSGTFQGHREFFSFGNRFDDLTVFLSYNRLDAESQPQSYFIDNTGLGTPKRTDTPVTGAVPVFDTRGTPSLIYGDTGPERVRSDLVKLKLGYAITPDLEAIFTGAFEERTRRTEFQRNYLTDAKGAPFYGDDRNSDDAVFAGSAFNVVNSGFGPSDDHRQTLQLGLQFKGAITDTWNIDSTISYLDVFTDNRSSAFFSPNDPLNKNTGQLQVFNEFNWVNYDLKLGTKELFGWEQLEFLGGYHFDNYTLGFQQFDLTDYANQVGKENVGRRNAGETMTNALFGQFAYHFLPDWDLTLGARYEWWSGENGIASGRPLPDRDDEAISPKASIGFEPDNWKFRYSFGRAYRFPVIAELYQNLQSPTSITTANALLNAEDGWHHNFMVEYGLPDGYVRVNVFRDDVRNLIQSVRRASGVLTESAFQNIPETSTTGVELIYDQQRVLGSDFDLSFNATWMDAIVEDGGPDIVFTEADGRRTVFNLTGKQRIRLPEWRFNVFTTYHINQAWDVSMAGRYTNDSFNDIDNGDTVNGVFGSQDGYFFLDFKTNYRFQNNIFGKDTKSRVSFGINNLTDETAFVFHPYPQRTFFIEGALSF
ncbi:TonB-dependent receptor [Methyloglobulus sp.]|uniref:TonB-dependent receptor n=1 Tax=Methyloglobulus sp. TaxID=2518622 RepID=UPI0039890A47